MFNRKDVVRSWVLENSVKITDVLVRQRTQAIQDTTFPELFDISERTLPEMHLCGAANMIALPTGYKPVHGTVTLRGNDVYEHTYGFNSQINSLIDFVAGQFFVRRGMKSGEAMAGLIVLAPALFTIIDQVVVLHGSVDLIKDNLGIKYA